MNDRSRTNEKTETTHVNEANEGKVPTPFFARKMKDGTMILRTGVRAGAAEGTSKAMEEQHKRW